MFSRYLGVLIMWLVSCSTVKMSQALQMQMEVQQRLHEQLEVLTFDPTFA